MSFINPIEILGLQNTDILNIDFNSIKKAKRKLQAEIELSDNGYIEFNGLKVSKGDAENSIDKLDDKEQIEFYYFISNNKKLSNFLTSGDLDLFNSFRQESIYKLPRFIEFLSPYFSESYDRALLKAFKNSDINTFKKIVSTHPIVSSSYLDKSYRSIFNYLKEKIKEIDNTAIEVKNGEGIYDEDNTSDIILWLEEELNEAQINLLPSYFQALRNQIAQSVRNLSVNTFNTFNDSEAAIDILDYALSFDIDGITKQKLTEDYNQLKQIDDSRLEEEKYAPILKKYAALLIGIKEKLGQLEKNSIFTPSVVANGIKVEVSIAELNSLDSIFDEIRNQICLGLRALSVGIWNKYQDINSALLLVSIASDIKSSNEITENIKDAKAQLLELERKIYASVVERKTTDSDNNTGCIVLVVIFVIGMIIYAISQSGSNSNSQTSTPSNNQESLTAKEPIKTESKYKGNRLTNGTSPFDACFGKGIYGGNATLTIKNGSLSDAIVCLYKTSTGETIRNEYVGASSEFIMSNISQGSYRIRVFFGNDWNPEKRNGCGTYGDFDSDISFSEFDKTYFFEDDDQGYTIATVTLYSVTGGNASSSPIDASKFFNK